MVTRMQVWHIWNVRTRNNSLLQQGIFSNPAVFGGIAWELSIMCIVVYVPWSYSLNNTLFQAYEVHVYLLTHLLFYSHLLAYSLGARHVLPGNASLHGLLLCLQRDGKQVLASKQVCE